jgi:hypothetical protein
MNPCSSLGASQDIGIDRWEVKEQIFRREGIPLWRQRLAQTKQMLDEPTQRDLAIWPLAIVFVGN